MMAKTLENNGAIVYIASRKLDVLEQAAREHNVRRLRAHMFDCHIIDDPHPPICPLLISAHTPTHIHSASIISTPSNATSLPNPHYAGSSTRSAHGMAISTY